MTARQFYAYLVSQARSLYDEREASQIADWVFESSLGLDRIRRITGEDRELNDLEKKQLNTILDELLQQQPVQYVLNEAWFDGLKLYVDEHVLIPRPETEELVAWIAEEIGKSATGEVQKVLDIGTGSGCISIALKKRVQFTEVSACDISEAALAVAIRNAETHQVEIDYTLLDFLDEKERNELPGFDYIISNPPYVPEHNKASMGFNVLKYEPHIALFVPDHDPLKFYKAIAVFAQSHLKAGGSFFVEIHEDAGKEVTDLFRTKGYSNIELRKDLQGKDRMVRVTLH